MKSVARALVALMLANCHFAFGDSPDFSKKAVGNAEVAAVRALALTQGDASSARRSQVDFTPEGWAEFNERMKGWLDEKGAPTFSETFTQSGSPLDLQVADDVVMMKLPGVLEQNSRNAAGGVSAVSYRVEVAVEFIASSGKLRKLATRMCGGAATRTSCR